MKKQSCLNKAFLGALLLGPVAIVLGQEGPPAGAGIIPDQYIVVLRQGADHAQVTARHGLAPDLVYRHALNGFAGFVPPGRLRKLQSDPDVAWVEPDQLVTLAWISTENLLPK